MGIAIEGQPDNIVIEPARVEPDGQADIAGWLTVGAAARRLGVTPEVVRRRVRHGRLNGVKDAAGQWWIDPSSLDRPAAQLALHRETRPAFGTEPAADHERGAPSRSAGEAAAAAGAEADERSSQALRAQAALIDRLLAEIERLMEQLKTENERLAEALQRAQEGEVESRRLLAAALERLPDPAAAGASERLPDQAAAGASERLVPSVSGGTGEMGVSGPGPEPSAAAAPASAKPLPPWRPWWLRWLEW